MSRPKCVNDVVAPCLPGDTDGTGSAAQFDHPYGVTVDGSGNVYVADTYNNAIRMVTPGGAVSTLAGGDAAQFYEPRGVAVDGSGNVYVADTQNNTIRKVTPGGVVSTLAGSPGVYGDVNATTGTAALFSGPRGVAVDGSGNVYVADTGSDTIRMVTPGGAVTTLAGTGASGYVNGPAGTARFYSPEGVAVDATGNVYVADANNGAIRKVTLSGVRSVSTLQSCSAYGVAVDQSGNVYVADGFYSIQKVTSTGILTTLAGSSNNSGTADGQGSAAQFQNPEGVAVDGSGKVYVADTNNNAIRIVTPGGAVSTLVDGTAAQFNFPQGIAVDGSGNVYVADTYNNAIRMVTPGGAVSTLAGGTAAQFNFPQGVAVDGSGNVYVADTGSDTIRKVTPGGAVTTFAGSTGVSGTADGVGTTAQFAGPQGVAVDANGNVYVADTPNCTIRKVTPGGVVSTLAGRPGVSGTADGQGSAAQFNFPQGVAVDRSGTVYVADTGNATIRMVMPSGVVTTVGGTPGSSGAADGLGATSLFSNPEAVAVSSNGILYVADSDNNRISKGVLGFPNDTTGAATGTVYNGTTLNGTINPNGLPTTWYFQYGTTTACSTGTTAAQPVGGGTSSIPVSMSVTDLAIGTTYYYELVAVNSSGTNYGPTQTFTTVNPPAPVVTTGVTTGITVTSGTLNGTINPEGLAVTCFFQYGPTTAYGNTTGLLSSGSGTSAGPVSTAIGGLTGTTTYHCQLVAVAANGVYYPGSDQTFQTAAPAANSPTVSTGAATGITAASGTLNGTVNPNGLTTSYSYQYGLTGTYGHATATKSAGSGMSLVSASAAITGLSPATTYHYQLIAANSSGTNYGFDQTFTTSAALFVTNNGANTVGEYDLTTGVAINASFINTGLFGPVGLAISGNHLFVANMGGNAVGEYDITNGTSIRTIAGSRLSSPSAVAISGNNLFVANFFDHSSNTIGEYDATTGAQINPSFIGPLSSPQGLLVAGSSLYVVNKSDTAQDGSTGTVDEYDTTTGALIPGFTPIPGLNIPFGVAISGSHLLVASATNANASLSYYKAAVGEYDATTGDATPGAVIPPSFIKGLAGPVSLLNSGTILYVGTSGSTVDEYDASTGALIKAGFIKGLNAPAGFAIAVPSPSVITCASSGIAATSGTLSGTVNPNGFPTTCYFQYGTTTAFSSGMTAVQAVGSGTSAVPVSVPITGLVGGTTYYYQLVTVSGNGTSYYSPPQAFTTPNNISNLQVSLNPNWNWVSFNVLPLSGTTVGQVLSGYTAHENDIIKSTSGQATYSGTNWFPSSFVISPNLTYKLHNGGNTNQTFAISGSAADTTVPITLVSGWNWIGYSPQAAQPVVAALENLQASENDTVKSQGGQATYSGTTWFPSNYQLSSGAGYLLKVAKAQTFQYQTGQGAGMGTQLAKLDMRPEATSGKGGPPSNWQQPTGCQYSMSVYAQVTYSGSSIGTGSGSVLAAFDINTGQCSGTTGFISGPSGQPIYQLQVWSNATNDTMTLKLYDGASGIVYALLGTSVTFPFTDGNSIGLIATPQVSPSILASSTSTLSSLTMTSGTLSPAFVFNTLSYSSTVANSVASVTVTPVVSDTAATVTVQVNGGGYGPVGSGSASGALVLAIGNNTIDVQAMAQDGSVSIYTIAVTRLPLVPVITSPSTATGTNGAAFSYQITGTNNPTSFSASPLPPGFSPVSATGLISGTPAQTGSFNVTIGASNLAGTGTAGLVLTILPNPDNTLSGLAVLGANLSPGFTPGTIAYSSTVANSVTSVTVTPVTSSTTATVLVNGTRVASGSASGSVALATGPNTIAVQVTAENGAVNAYTIVVIRQKSSVNTLSSLTMTSGTLSPVFTPGTVAYSSTVANSVTSMTVTPTVLDTTAMVTVNGTGVASGNTSGSLPLNVGTNTISIAVTAQNQAVNTYTIVVIRQQSSVNTLSGLTLISGTWSMVLISSSGTNYTPTVPNGIASVAVIPTALDTTATVTVDGTLVGSGSASGALALATGSNNTISIMVTAQDGTPNPYTIVVTRQKSSVNTLSSLTLTSGTLSPAFVFNTLNYGSTVANSVTSVKVTPTVSDTTATVRVDGTSVTSGSASGALTLTTGSNTITIPVTAQDGSVSIYTISVTRLPLVPGITSLSTVTGTNGIAFSYQIAGTNNPTSYGASPLPSGLSVNPATGLISGTPAQTGSFSSVILSGSNLAGTGTAGLVLTILPNPDNTLSGLTMTSGTLSPVFTPGTVAYSSTVANSVTSMTVTPTTSSTTATVLVNGTAVTSGSASGFLTLATGTNVISIPVTAEKGGAPRTYTISVTRLPLVPVITSPSTATGTNGIAFSYQIAGTNNPTSYGASPLPSGLSVSPTTGLISGTPAQTGTFSSVILSGSNLAGTGTAGLVLTILPNPDNTLSGLTMTSGTLSPVFTPGTVAYSSTVANSVTSMTVTPTTSSTTATVLVDGTSVASGGASGSLGLATGSNTINVQVTAEDKGSPRAYTITVIRLPLVPAITSPLKATATQNSAFSYQIMGSSNPTSYGASPLPSGLNATVNPATGLISGTPTQTGTFNVTLTASNLAGTGTAGLVLTVLPPGSNATLSALALTSGTLNPGFTSSGTSYTVTAANSVASMAIMPTLSDSNATVQVSGTGVVSGGTSGFIGLNVGDNPIPVSVTAQDGKTRMTYTVVVHRKSADATLASLGLSQATLSPAFSSSGTSYTASVPFTTANTIVSATLTSATARVSGTGNRPLVAGTANPLNIVVTAEDGNTLTYAVVVTRSAPSSVATLSALALTSGTLNPTFASSGTSYTATVVNSVTSEAVVSTLSDTNATVQVSGTGTNGSISLNVGDNPIHVQVTAQDDKTTMTYTVVVHRKSADATLASLGLSAGTLSPAFSSSGTSYTATVPYTITSTIVSATASSAAATVTGSTGSQPIVAGTTTPLSIVVTAEDGNSLTYTLAVDSLFSPAISSSPVVTATADFGFSYQIVATNAPASYDAPVLPPELNATVNPATGLITGTPTQTGTFNATVSATNLAGTGTAALVLTTVPPPLPVITSTSVVTGTAGVAFSYQITASNNPTGYGVTGVLPNGLTSSTSTGVISGTPTQTGTFSATISASNLAGTGTAGLVLTIVPHFLSGEYSWSNFAGMPGGPGNVNGTGSAARFYYPQGVAVAGNGNVYVADTYNHTIRMMTPGGMVTTLAGSPGVQGSADGTGSEARFCYPQGIAVDGSGNVYVADTYNDTIRMVAPGGIVTTLAGSPGVQGSADGTGSAAQFNGPSGVTVDGSGNVYVADYKNHTIRMVTPDGMVTTLAGSAGNGGSADGTGSAAQFYFPQGIAVDGSGNVYVADTYNYTIRMVTPGGIVTTLAGSPGVQGIVDGRGNTAQFYGPSGVTVDGSGNVYVADSWNHTIRRVMPGGVVTTLAGSPLNKGSADGTGSVARFNFPCGVAVDGSGNVYVADSDNMTIRKVTSNGVVTTLAGSPGVPGSADGTGSAARFNGPSGVTVDGSGKVYVADTSNNTIRMVTPGGAVTTLAGGSWGSANGMGGDAQFYYPRGVAVDGSGNVYVADTQNNTIRKVMPDGAVTNVAGNPSILDSNRQPAGGYANGTGSAARFNFPCGVAVDGSGDVYVADTSNNTIRKVASGGVVTTLAGSPGVQGSADGTGSAARFRYPQGIAVDGSGNVYVADSLNNTIRKVTSGGVVTTLAGSPGVQGSADGMGSAAQFSNPKGISVDGSGNVYVVDTVSDTIRKVTSGGMVTTIGGTPGVAGSADGMGSTALFAFPSGVTVSANGILYVADMQNNRISKGVPATFPTVITGTATGTGYNATTLDGTVNPNGSATTCYFQYGTTDAYGLTTAPQSAGNSAMGTDLSVPISCLTSATTYHYQLVAVNSSGTNYGFDQTFTTDIAPGPQVTTGSPNWLGINLASLEGTVNPNGQETTYCFQYGTTALYGMTTGTADAGSGTSLSGIGWDISLSPAPIYHYRIVATNNNGTSYGNDQTFVLPMGLSALQLSAGALTPGFSGWGTTYSLSVPNGVKSTTVTATKTNATASIRVQVNGGAFSTLTSGGASTALPLNVGMNTIVVRAIPTDGFPQDYTITVTRAPSSNANLALWTCSGGAIAPALSLTGTSYAAKVAYSGSNVTVTPVVSDTTATVAVRVNGGTYITGTSGKACGPLALNVGANAIDVQVTAQDGVTAKTYTLTATRTGSSDATLSGLVQSNGTLAPLFKPATVAYSGSVGNSVTSVTVTPTVNEPNATITVQVNGGAFSPVGSGTASSALPLKTGINTIGVKVTAQDGVTVKTYTLTVTRGKNGNAFLSGLTLGNATLAPVFASTSYSYSGTVASAIATVTAIKATDDPNASPTIQVQVNGGAYSIVGSGSASGPLALRFGTTPNLINVKVTSEDGSSVHTYAINVTRVKSSNADLSSLTLNAAPITPQFLASGTGYSANVANCVGSVTVTPVHSDPSAVIKVRVNGMPAAYNAATSGVATGLLTLTSGTAGSVNSIEVKVTSEDGTVTKVYTIAVHRVALPVTGVASAGSGSVAFNGAVDGNVGSAVFQYGLTTTYTGGAIPALVGGTTSLVPVSAATGGLTPATVYHYRVKATTNSLSDYGSDQTFVTTQIVPAGDVAMQGDVVLLASGSGKFLSFGNPAINDMGHEAFQATLAVSGTAVAAANNSGIWMETGSGTTLVARTGLATSYWSGGTLQSGTFTAISGDPVLNNQDQVAFLGTVVSGTGRSVTTCQGIWVTGTAGGLVQMAQTLERVPDVTGTLTGATIASFTQFVLTDQGSVAFLASLTNGVGGVSAVNNQGVWVVDATGQWRFIARIGFPLATGTGSKITALSIFAAAAGVGGQTRSFNTNDELMFAATFADTTQGVYTVTPDGTVLLISQNHESAPITTSGTSGFATFNSPIVNDSGNAAFQAVITGSGITAAKGNNIGIWTVSGTAGAPSQVARIGVSTSYAQGLASGTAVVTGTFTALGDPVFNANDEVAFIGTVKTLSGSVATSTQGIWATGSAGGLFQVTQAQAQAAGCPTGAKFASFVQLVLPDSGGPVFVANLVPGAGGVTASNSQGIWSVDTNGNTTLVARTGDAVVVSGKTMTIQTLSIFSSSAATAGQTRSFNASGDLIYKVTFVGGTQGIYKVMIP